MYVQSYKELIVWQKSVDLVEEIYFLTNQLPKEEIYGLSSQMRRSSISIPSNIAEGQRRKDLPEFLHFLRIADVSSAELETQVIICKRLYSKLDYAKVDGLLEEIQKMLTVMMSKLELKAQSSKLTAQKGQVMIEMLIATTVIIVGLLGIFSLTSRSLSLNSVAGSQYIAANLAAEGIEVVKNIIDGNKLQKNPAWNWGIDDGDYQINSLSIELKDRCGDECPALVFDPITGLYGYSAGAPTPYRRKVSVNAISSDEIKVTSTVDWTTRDNAKFQIALEDYFFNWRP